MKLRTKKYKSILSISILTSLGIGTMMITNYGNIESNVDTTKPVQQIDVGRTNASIIDSNGDLWMWGINSTGQLGNGESGVNEENNRLLHSTTPINITQQEGNPLQGTTIEQVELGQINSAAIDSDGNLWMWGGNFRGSGGEVLGSSPLNVTEEPGSPLQGITMEQISTDRFSFAAIDSNGDVWTWGDNRSGELGRDIEGDFDVTPTKITDEFDTDEEIVRIEHGNNFVGAIDSSGDLWMWGNNSYGQLGDGTKSDYNSTPINISESNAFSGAKITQIAFSEIFSGAIDSSGDLWLWGVVLTENTNISDRTVPTNITELTNSTISGREMTQISFGDDHGAAIDSTGDLWMWGKNNLGQLGNPTLSQAQTDLINIKLDSTDPGVEKLAMAGDSSFVLDDEGELWSWGSNSYGQLGNGSSGAKDYDILPNKITNEFIFIYDSYFSNVTSTEATLHYMLDIGKYEPEDITVQYRSNGGEWIDDTNASSTEANQINLTDLHKGRDYNYEIRVVLNTNLDETISLTSIDKFTTQVTTPEISELSISNITSSSATLNYTLDLSGHAPGDITVEYRSKEGEGEWSEWILDGNVPSTGSNEIKVTGLLRETTYDYEIRVLDANGIELISDAFDTFTTIYSFNSLEMTGIVVGSIAGMVLIGTIGFYVFKISTKKNDKKNDKKSTKKKA